MSQEATVVGFGFEFFAVLLGGLLVVALIRCFGRSRPMLVDQFADVCARRTDSAAAVISRRLPA